MALCTMLRPPPPLRDQGVGIVDAEDVAASPARQVPQLGRYGYRERLVGWGMCDTDRSHALSHPWLPIAHP